MRYTRKVAISAPYVEVASPSTEEARRKLVKKKQKNGVLEDNEQSRKRPTKVAKRGADSTERRDVATSNGRELIELVTKRLAEDDRTRWKQYVPELQKIVTKPPTDVLEHVKYKDRAIKLLDRLNGIVTWSSDGTASVRGKEIPYSHIGDLVEAYFNPENPRPIGWARFKTVIPTYGETKDTSQWEDWPGKRSPKARKVKSGRKT